MQPKWSEDNNNIVVIMDMVRNELQQIKKELGKPSYQSLGFKRNPFTPVIGLNSIPNLIDRAPERQTFVRYFAQMLRGEIKDITILSKKGRGKTHFLLYYYDTLKRSENQDILTGYTVEFIKNEKEFSEYALRPSIKGKAILFIDECENIWSQHAPLFKVIYDSPNILTICAWNLNSWTMAKKETAMMLPKTQNIVLKEMDRNAMLSILNDRIKNNLMPGVDCPITKDAKDMLIDYSKGVPLTLITTANNCLDYAINNGMRKIDKSLVSKNVLGDNTERRDARLYALREAQMETLIELHNMLTSYKREISIAEYCRITGQPRSTVVYNIGKLEKEGMIRGRKIGKERRFTINPEYSEFFESLFDEPLRGRRNIPSRMINAVSEKNEKEAPVA